VTTWNEKFVVNVKLGIGTAMRQLKMRDRGSHFRLVFGSCSLID